MEPEGAFGDELSAQFCCEPKTALKWSLQKGKMVELGK